MQKITETRDRIITKAVKQGTETVDVFVADDGKKFEGFMAQQRCAHYEKMWHLFEIVKTCKVVNATWFNDSLPCVYYKTETQEQLNAITEYFINGNTRARVYVNDENHPIKLGDWIGYTIVQDETDNGWDVITFYTLDFVSDNMAVYLDALNNRDE